MSLFNHSVVIERPIDEVVAVLHDPAKPPLARGPARGGEPGGFNRPPRAGRRLQ